MEPFRPRAGRNCEKDWRAPAMLHPLAPGVGGGPPRGRPGHFHSVFCDGMSGPPPRGLAPGKPVSKEEFEWVWKKSGGPRRAVGSQYDTAITIVPGHESYALHRQWSATKNKKIFYFTGYKPARAVCDSSLVDAFLRGAGAKDAAGARAAERRGGHTPPAQPPTTRARAQQTPAVRGGGHMSGAGTPGTAATLQPGPLARRRLTGSTGVWAAGVEPPLNPVVGVGVAAAAAWGPSNTANLAPGTVVVPADMAWAAPPGGRVGALQHLQGAPGAKRKRTGGQKPAVLLGGAGWSAQAKAKKLRKGVETPAFGAPPPARPLAGLLAPTTLCRVDIKYRAWMIVVILKVYYDSPPLGSPPPPPTKNQPRARTRLRAQTRA